MLKVPFGDAKNLARVAAMMTGSYIGGGVNFAAMASQYAAGEGITAAATVADNLLMAAYFFILIAFSASKFFKSKYNHPLIDAVEDGVYKKDAQTQAAAGMAISQGWTALVGPAMLVGTLGYVLGNYMGTVVAIALGL